jgi:hypothetical protein
VRLPMDVGVIPRNARDVVRRLLRVEV